MPTAAPTMGGALVVKVGGVAYATEPGPSQDAYDRKYSELELATGNRFNVVDMQEGDSEVKWNVTKVLEDTDGPLMTICGAGATVGLPTSTTVVYYLPEYTRTLLNCLVNDVEWTWEHGKPTMVSINGMATSAPADTVGVAAPTITLGNFFYFKDLLTFYTKAVATPAPARKLSIKLDHQLFSFPGIRADGLTLPTSLTPTVPKVTGAIEKLMVDDLDYLLYLAACQLKADIGLTAKSFCASGGLTATIVVKNAFYMSKPSRSGSVKEATIEQFNFQAVNVGAANPLTFALA